MNLFVLDDSPIISAQNNCDVHCNKMYLEVIQMLTNVFPAESFADMYPTKKGTVRKLSHINHPISKWVRQCKQNFNWTLTHALTLGEERLYRGMNPHFSTPQLDWIVNNQQYLNLSDRPQTPFAVAIESDAICRSRIFNFDKKSVIDQYKLFYVFDKTFATWTVRQIPDWFTEMKIQYRLV